MLLLLQQQSKHDIKGELSVLNFENTRQDQGMIQQHLSKWDINLYLTESALLIN